MRLRSDRQARRPREDHRPAGSPAEAPQARSLSGYRLTVRHGPDVSRQTFDDLNEAIEAASSEVERIQGEGNLPAISALRDFEPGQRVHARIEIAAPGLLRRRGGLDVKGDGSVVAYSGSIRKDEIEPASGESVYDALRTALAR